MAGGRDTNMSSVRAKRLKSAEMMMIIIIIMYSFLCHFSFGALGPLQQDQQLVTMVETVISDDMSLHCHPRHGDSKPIFLHDTLAHGVASPYQVWLQKVQQVRRHRSGEQSLEF